MITWEKVSGHVTLLGGRTPYPECAMVTPLYEVAKGFSHFAPSGSGGLRSTGSDIGTHRCNALPEGSP